MNPAEVYIEQTLLQLANGDKGVFEVLGNFNLLKKRIDEVVKDLRVQALEEMGSDESFEAHGFKFKRQSGKSNYKYNHLPWWDEYQKKVEEAKGAAISAMSGKINAYTDGEVIEPAIVEFSKESITITKK